MMDQRNYPHTKKSDACGPHRDFPKLHPGWCQDGACPIGIGQDDARMMASMPEQAPATTGWYQDDGDQDDTRIRPGWLRSAGVPINNFCKGIASDIVNSCDLNMSLWDVYMYGFNVNNMRTCHLFIISLGDLFQILGCIIFLSASLAATSCANQSGLDPTNPAKDIRKHLPK